MIFTIVFSVCLGMNCTPQYSEGHFTKVSDCQKAIELKVRKMPLKTNHKLECAEVDFD